MILAFISGAVVLGFGVVIGAAISQNHIQKILDINSEEK